MKITDSIKSIWIICKGMCMLLVIAVLCLFSKTFREMWCDVLDEKEA